jgi:protein SCO1/2/putative membrane protein
MNETSGRLRLPAKRIVLALLVLAGSARGQTTDSLYPDEPLWPAPSFTLTDQTGQPFSSEQLRGKLWVAHFFYTTCTGGCTKTAPTMRDLQQLVRDKRGIQLVSISLNNDSPEDLERYAEGLGADAKQWAFLTGPKDKVFALAQEGFKISAREEADAKPGLEITHDFWISVVDAKGNVRGYLDGRSESAARELFNRLLSLDRSRQLFPAVNAMLNFQCAVLLLLGYAAIRQRRETLHKVAMLSALVVSIVFLTSYLYYHIVIMGGEPTRFRGEGWARVVYFAILLSHTVLAVAVAPLALFVTYEGLRDRRPRHVRVARWTLPIWLYVSVTGVVVYWMLYHLYPAG